ncbi:transposase [Prauserella sediminis]|uniref:transposase n=1 Tax=Prauserella sediminis TaxID=577680 RepID=UPI001617B3B6
MDYWRIQAHPAEIYATDVSKGLISRVAGQFVDALDTWQQRPLHHVYPALLIDATHVQIREGQVTNRPNYVIVGINCGGAVSVMIGHRLLLSRWCGWA